MKQFPRCAFPVAAIAVMAVPAAEAADYDPVLYPAAEVVEEYVPVEIGSGWYIRGDLGYSLSTNGSVSTYRTFAGGVYGSDSFDTGDIDSDFSISVGAGYIFNEWLRADATIDVFRGDFTGSTSAPAPCPGIATVPADDTTCASSDTADYYAYTLMANGYVDLGTFVGFTPYVGGGVGVTWVNWRDLNSTIFCVDGAIDLCPGAASASTTSPGLTEARFTYSLMAGAAYDITDTLKLDVGYRYQKIDGGDFFGFGAATAAAGASGVQARDNGLESHQIRVGLRYEIW